ncbi:MAG: DUF5924 family protein [Nevskia sp.]
MPSLETSPPAPVTRIETLVALLERHRRPLAVATFGFGVGSFLLVQRHEWLARWIAGLLLLGWLLMLFEGLIARWLAGGRWARLSPLMLRLAMQQVHQETFFFCLPFFLATTTWHSTQAVFTVLITAAGLCSMWDPLYFDRIAARPALYLAFHALAMYTAALTVGPLLLQLSTAQTLALSSIVIAVFAMPSLAQLTEHRGLRGGLLLMAGAAAFGAAAWLLRAHVPPATLWLRDAAITHSVDAEAHAPGAAVKRVHVGELAGGLYAFGAIHAPRGLRERVDHCWLMNGREIDRIPLVISGGRESGYRVWSWKQSFPADPRGRWEVRVVTESGQLIGLMRFEVVD